MSDSMASELKGRLFVPVKLIRLFIVLLFIGGLCCIFGGLLFVILSYRQTVSSKKMTSPEDFFKDSLFSFSF